MEEAYGKSVDLALGAQLRRVITRLSRQLNASATVIGLTPAQASALGLIAARGPISLAELTAIEGLNPTMVSRVVGRLVEDRLISRVPNQHDLRSVSVEITAEGAELHERVSAERARVVAACLDRLPEASRAQIATALPALEELVAELMRQ